jgi:hypothetical protein
VLLITSFSREKLSIVFFFFGLEPDLAPTLQRLGTELPLSSTCTSYYKLVQIKQQRELNVGCYSPEARTSINLCVSPFTQLSEARHAIREIY